MDFARDENGIWTIVPNAEEREPQPDFIEIFPRYLTSDLDLAAYVDRHAVTIRHRAERIAPRLPSHLRGGVRRTARRRHPRRAC
jgi:hypothetical protein